MFSSVLAAGTVLLSLSSCITAYRPLQHCRQDGEYGHYSGCMTMTQHYNASTNEPDLYVRYHWFRYDSSKSGWHAFALGQQMAGAFMATLYGDSTTGQLTTSIRSAEAHQQPRPISEIAVFSAPEAKGRIPAVDIITSEIVPYTGLYVNAKTKKKPSHVGVSEVIIRGFSKWVGCKITNSTTKEPMIWSSRYDQDFAGDFSTSRNLDMHGFGTGFGNVFMDIKNAETPFPMFAPVDEVANPAIYGIAEIEFPALPTSAELELGERQIAGALNDPVNAALQATSTPSEHQTSGGENNPFNDHNTDTSTVPEIATPPPSTEPEHTHDGTPPVYPAFTVLGKSLRDWMWHLHGTLMCLAFFIIYPLGIYYLRQNKASQNGLAFNYHWTVQALATLVMAIGAFIGYLQSRSISVTHQYVGIAIVTMIATQMVLGYRHHVLFLQFKRKTWLSRVHIGLGRVILPMGFVNILSGMKLRGYGWFTMALVLVLIVVEVVFGAVYLRRAAVRRNMAVGNAAEELKQVGPGATDDAEEYFQLAGPEDEWSDDDEDVSRKREEKSEQAQRLAKLDRV